MRRGLWLGFVALGLLGAGLAGWGYFASIAGAVIAAGQVETEGGEQAVEHVEGGTVSAILVQSGDAVAEGEVLVRIDGSALATEASVLEGQLWDLVARGNRLVAEFHEGASIAWDPDLQEAAGKDPSVREKLDGHRRLFETRTASREGLVKQLRERIEQTRRQVEGLKAKSRALVRQNELMLEELGAKEALFEKGLKQLPEILSLKRGAAYLDGEAGDVEAQIASAGGRIAELESQILQTGMEWREAAEAEAREVQVREDTVRGRLRAVRDRLGRLEVRAPVSGVVHDLSVTAVGEVLEPGEAVAKVVPEGAGFTVRARLAPTDVEQVWPGQPAVLRFSAFAMRTTPTYKGIVERVSADALTDDRTGEYWYEVVIGIGEALEAESEGVRGAWMAGAGMALGRWLGWTETEIPSEGNTQSLPSLALTPGMPVEVYLRTDDRSPLGYLLKPLSDYFTRALREE